MATVCMPICAGLECADVIRLYSLLYQACLNIRKGNFWCMAIVTLCDCQCQLGLKEVTTTSTDRRQKLLVMLAIQQNRDLEHLPALLNAATAAVHSDQA